MQKDIASQIEKYGTTKERAIAKSCLQSIARGAGFSQGLKPWVSANAYLGLLGGEKASNFEQGLRDALGALKVDEASGSAIAKVLIKPLLGVLLLLLVSALLAAYAFPSLSEQAPRQTWGFLSLSGEQFGLFWLHNGLYVLGLFSVLLPLMVLSLSRYCGEHRVKLDVLPVYRQYRFIHCTNFLTSTAHQTAVGTPLKESLEHYREHATPYMKHHINTMLRALGAGKSNIGDILDSGLLDAEELDTVKLLSDSGNASVILKKSALMHSEQLLLEIDRLKTWGSRILFTLLATVGAWMALGVGSLALHIATTFSLT
ncbi:hypothetical protein [Vibrio sinensis]|nr:hypothetical protein [Vibrio sinensis]